MCVKQGLPLRQNKQLIRNYKGDASRQSSGSSKCHTSRARRKIPPSPSLPPIIPRGDREKGRVEMDFGRSLNGPGSTFNVVWFALTI